MQRALRARIRPALAPSAIVLILAVTLGAALGRASAARADGDPASDVLLGQNVFYPYSPPVSAALQKQLDELTAQAARRGFPLKVALIASPVDLGVVPDLFDKPTEYARFLDQEISFHTLQPLLVVMPGGYGVNGLDKGAAAAAKKLQTPAGKTSDALATAALGAVRELAAAAGHPLAAIPGTRNSGGGGTNVLLVILIALAVLTAAALATVSIRRTRRTGRES